MPTIDVVVEKRLDDYKAHISGDTTRWDCGKSEAEAIGKLILSRRYHFGITILRKPKPKKGSSQLYGR